MYRKHLEFNDYTPTYVSERNNYMHVHCVLVFAVAQCPNGEFKQCHNKYRKYHQMRREREDEINEGIFRSLCN